MYINFEYCKKQGLSLLEVTAIQLIHQNSNGDMEEHLEELPRNVLNKLFNMELLKFVRQARKNQTTRNRVRLSKHGKDFYTRMTTYKLIEDDEKIYNFLQKVFSKLDKTQVSRNKMLKLIASFRLESGLNAKEVYELCKAFVNDSDAMEYTHKMDYLIFKPENAYSKFNLGDSRLWNYHESKTR